MLASAPVRPTAPVRPWLGRGDLESLPDQRWAVIAPEGSAGDVLLEAIAPLIALRAEQQRAPVQIRRWPAAGVVQGTTIQASVRIDRPAESDLTVLLKTQNGVLQTPASVMIPSRNTIRFSKSRSPIPICR